MIYLVVIVVLVLVLVLAYAFYQLKRNDKVYFIREKWMDTNDYRFDKYTYDYMLKPNKNNWFGLRFPKEKHFKK